MDAWLVAAFIPLLQLINGLPFLYMGWGGREIAMAATLGAAGHLTVNETLAVSVIWGAVLIVSLWPWTSRYLTWLSPIQSGRQEASI